MEKEIKCDYFGIERDKDIYLKEFKRERNTANQLFSPGTDVIADEIVSLLKTKELTYEEAYAGKNYSDLQRESYKMLEEKAGCNLKQRVENMKMRALTNVLLELATRKGVEEILEVSGSQEFKIKIGANEYLYQGPLSIVVIDKSK